MKDGYPGSTETLPRSRQQATSGERPTPGAASEAPLVSDGWLVPLLLASMLEGNVHGGRIKQRVEELGFGLPRPETVYRALHQMEQEGLLVSNRRGAEVLLSGWWFEPTEAGMAYLEFWTDSLANYREEIDRFLELRERLNPDREPGGPHGFPTGEIAARNLDGR